MSNDPTPIKLTERKGTLGERIRNIADQLKHEGTIQIKATSRILGAAAQISENHDRLINEVVEMAEEDLDQQVAQPSGAHTVEQLKQQFKTLNSAKTHFGLKVSSWAALTAKLNEQSGSLKQLSNNDPKDSVHRRLEAIEREIKLTRSDMEQALKLLDIVLQKLS